MAATKKSSKPKTDEPATIAPEGTLAALYEASADESRQNYLIGISRDAPFDSFDVAGVSFERRIGTFDKVTQTWSYQEGRIVPLAANVARQVQKELELRYVKVRYLYDDEKTGKLRGVRVQRQARKGGRGMSHELAHPVRFEAYPNNHNATRKLSEWLPLKHFATFEQTSASSRNARPNDVLLAENRTQRQRIEELEKLLNDRDDSNEGATNITRVSKPKE